MGWRLLWPLPGQSHQETELRNNQSSNGIRQIEAKNQNNTQTPARALPPKKSSTYTCVQGLILPLDKRSLLRGGLIWDESQTKATDFNGFLHPIPFSQAPLANMTQLMQALLSRLFSDCAFTLLLELDHPLC